ncbi:hypothetical protein [Dyadobacter sp. 22481]|uniref:hypothetical protein n=1 Tax=Dyadobacter sp. 22481 TaxID=3453926 RepID=UPI003F82F4A7
MPFIVLVDYDNLDPRDRKRGLIFIVENTLSKFNKSEIAEKNVQIRLYGGWYENNVITRRAQDINIEIVNDFPRSVLLDDNKTAVITNVTLALSLAIEPRVHLLNTFRKRGVPSGLHTNHPRTTGCPSAACPVVHVHNFVKTGVCSSCSLATPENIFYRAEQKLVDTMITSDMIAIGHQEKHFCIVSSDDDFWPGIFSAVIGGSVVYHMHTKGRHTPPHYSSTVSSNYFQKNF